MASDKKRIYIDGKEYATLEEVPAHLRAQVQQQLQGVDAARYPPPTTRRRMGLSARGGGGGRGDGPSGAPLLIVSGLAFLLLVGLLYFIGR